jgi:small subunit ribosomal protein S17
MPKRVEIGVVTSDKMNKTRVVQIPRRVKHPRYGKYIRRRTICHVHDENNTSHEGDTVEIIESRPRSKMKRWDLVRVVETSREVDIAALKAVGQKEIELAEQERAAIGEHRRHEEGRNEAEEQPAEAPSQE